jgi:hypothetical protein
VCVCVFTILDPLNTLIQEGTDILNTPYDRIVARDHDDEEDRDP